jgi:hypothetical protein
MMPPARRTYALTHDELAALRRVQEGAPAQGPRDPVWSYLMSIGLVWLDTDVQPATIRLSSAGSGYATD